MLGLRRNPEEERSEEGASLVQEQSEERELWASRLYKGAPSPVWPQCRVGGEEMGDGDREVMQEHCLGFGVIVRTLASILSKRRSHFSVLRKGIWWPVKVNEARYPGDYVGNRCHQKEQKQGHWLGGPSETSGEGWWWPGLRWQSGLWEVVEFWL